MASIIDDKLVSIITASYNSEKYISHTINSVLQQSYQNWEMIIVDDKSLDNSIKVIENYQKQDSRIKLHILDQNRGAAVARNEALQRAQGKYIAFLDSDDLWLPNKLELQLNFMQKNNCAVSCTSYELIDDHGNRLDKIIKSLPTLSFKQYLKNTRIGFSSSIIDKSKTGHFEMTNMRPAEDAKLWIDILKKGHAAYGMPDVLMQYRVRLGSLSSNKWKTSKQIWKIYYNIEKLGFWSSIYYFSCYLFNAVKKRL